MKRQFNIKYTPVQLWIAVNEYFAKGGEDNIASLLLYLKIGQWKWRNYCKDPKYRDATDYANLKIQESYEDRLKNDKNPTGAIFALKNMGWSDKQDVNVAMETDLTIEQVVKGQKMKA